MTRVLATDVAAALVARLTAMADDELILGHRDAEWTGHAPLLEEDIALANIAQDEIGHAVLWLELRSQLDDSDPDALAFFRDAGDFRNARLVELPRGDWAFTLLRQFLFDAHEAELLAALSGSSYRPLAEAAGKAATEEVFHLRHTGLWLERLAHGTDESAARIGAALERLAPYLPQLTEPLPGDSVLERAGVLPSMEAVGRATRTRIEAALAAVGLDLPQVPANPGGRERHTEDLVTLLIDMQAVARADPEAEAW